MDWVKRNLVFVIGGVTALVLLSLSGYYLYSNSQENRKARELLEAEYQQLQRLSNLKPHPGKGKVDNIRRAREQKEEVRDLIAKVRNGFEPIPAEPPSAKVTGEEFSASLRRTLDQLTQLAESSSVMIPTDYSFSFEAEKRLVKFAPGSLNRLAVELGEVKAIVEILCDAKVNKLTGLRRVRVSADDLKGPQTDYIAAVSVTNDLAVISPYEISFESFSAELGAVMTGFANSPHGLVIKEISVRPASAAPTASSRFGYDAEAGASSVYSPATPAYATPNIGSRYGGGAAYAPPNLGSRYGGGGGAAYAPPNIGSRYGGAGGGGGIRQPEFRTPDFNSGAGSNPYGAAMGQPNLQARYGQATAPAATYPAGTYPGTAMPVSQTLIDEQPLSVTMVVEVIKLLPMPEE